MGVCELLLGLDFGHVHVCDCVVVGVGEEDVGGFEVAVQDAVLV